MTTQYVQGKNNYWMSLADGSGPYVLGPGGAYALEGIQGSVITASGPGFFLQNDGFWYNLADSSGPYVRLNATQYAMANTSGSVSYSTTTGAVSAGGTSLVYGGLKQAADFGFVAGSNNTLAFATLATYLANLPSGSTHTRIVFGPGKYYADKIEFLPPVDGLTATIEIEGASQCDTVWIPNATSNPVFATIDAAYLAYLNFSNLSIVGIGATNPRQDGLAVIPFPRALDNTGGVSYGKIRRLTVNGFDGQQYWQRGSQKTTGGLFANRWPMQFLQFDQCVINSSNGRPSFESIGQFGQSSFDGGDYDGNGITTCGGPGISLSAEYRVAIQPTSANTGTNVISTGGILYWPSCTPCRMIGTTLPSGLALGTTYFMVPNAATMNGASPVLGDFILANSLSNAGTKTAVALGTAGTPANYSLVALYALSLTGNVWATEYPHKFVTGDQLRFVGASLPSGVATATNYYAIRIDHTHFALASSEANALAGTQIAVSGGAVTAYGWVTNDGTILSPSGPYSIKLNNPTVQSREIGVRITFSQDIDINVHVEQTRRAIEIVESQVSIRSGVFANGASDGGNGVLFYVEGFTSQVEVTGMPTMSGTVDKIYTLPNAAQGAFRFTSPPTSTGITPTNASTGDAYQLGAAATINIGAHERIFVNTSATQITTIASNHTVGKRIRIVAWSGTIVFATGGNLSLGSNASPFTLASGAMAEFEMWDTIGTWILVGHS